MFKSILKVLKSVREYKIFAIITPLFMIGEAAVECFLPYVMSEFVGKIEVVNGIEELVPYFMLLTPLVVLLKI